ncbi:hypothetical protein bcgnr5380_56610 [Bacillus cereus]
MPRRMSAAPIRKDSSWAKVTLSEVKTGFLLVPGVKPGGFRDGGAPRRNVRNSSLNSRNRWYEPVVRT